MAERNELSIGLLRAGQITDLNGDDLDTMPRLVTKSITTLANGYQALFTVTGQVRIDQIYGQVTTGIENAAVSAKLSAGISTNYTDLCAAASVQNALAGVMLSCTGTVANALLTSVATITAVIAQATPWVVKDGATIYQNNTAAKTGKITWYVRYTPLTVGAVITAA